MFLRCDTATFTIVEHLRTSFTMVCHKQMVSYTPANNVTILENIFIGTELNK